MTVETKTTIQLSDIKTIEFECAKCHTVTSYPLELAKQAQGSCANGCGEWMPYAGDTYKSITQLIDLVKRFGNATSEPYTLRFGIKPASASGHAADSKA